MERSADDVIALMADVLGERVATTKYPEELITIASLASQFMQKLTPSSGQENEPMDQPSTSPMSPVNSAGTSSSDLESDWSYIGQALTELSELLEKKNSDYKLDGEFSNFEFAASAAGVPVRRVMMAQVGIKMGRILGILQSTSAIQNEPLLDSFKDLAGYAVILYAYELSKE